MALANDIVRKAPVTSWWTHAKTRADFDRLQKMRALRMPTITTVSVAADVMHARWKKHQNNVQK